MSPQVLGPLAGLLAAHGVDLLDVSTSGNSPHQRIKGGPGYQVPFAEAVKRAHGDKILVAAVGQIYDGALAQRVLDEVRSMQRACGTGADAVLTRGNRARRT